jgi:hypothetical protein
MLLTFFVVTVLCLSAFFLWKLFFPLFIIIDFVKLILNFPIYNLRKLLST